MDELFRGFNAQSSGSRLGPVIHAVEADVEEGGRSLCGVVVNEVDRQRAFHIGERTCRACGTELHRRLNAEVAALPTCPSHPDYFIPRNGGCPQCGWKPGAAA